MKKNKHTEWIEARTAVIEAAKTHITVWDKVPPLSAMFVGPELSRSLGVAFNIAEKALIDDLFLCKVEWGDQSTVLALYDYLAAARGLGAVMAEYVRTRGEEQADLLASSCVSSIAAAEKALKALIPPATREVVTSVFPDALNRCVDCVSFKNFCDYIREFSDLSDTVSSGLCARGNYKPVLVSKSHSCEMWESAKKD